MKRAPWYGRNRNEQSQTDSPIVLTMQDHPAVKERELLVNRVNELCAELNNLGHSPPWSQSQLRLYINAKYDVSDGLDSMGGASFQDLIEFLERQVAGHAAYADAEISLAGPGAIHSLERAAVAAERS